MFYGSREDQDKKTRSKIDAIRQAAGLYPIIRDIVAAFDGKVYNCRLEKALKEVDRHIYVEKRFNCLSIGCYVTNYNECFTLASIRLADLPEGKRIPATLIIEDARKRRAGLLRRAADLSVAMENVDYYKGQLEHYAAQIKKIVDMIPCEVRDTYNLDYRVRH